MIARLVSRVAGPKVLIGVVASAALAITVLGWLWRGAADEAAQSARDAQEYRQALENTNTELDRMLRERRELDQALAERRAMEREAQARAREAERRLQALEESDEAVADWSDDRVPAGVRSWLLDDTGAGDPDGGSADKPAGEPVAGVPGTGGDDRDER